MADGDVDGEDEGDQRALVFREDGDAGEQARERQQPGAGGGEHERSEAEGGRQVVLERRRAERSCDRAQRERDRDRCAVAAPQALGRTTEQERRREQADPGGQHPDQPDVKDTLPDRQGARAVRDRVVRPQPLDGRDREQREAGRLVGVPVAGAEGPVGGQAVIRVDAQRAVLRELPAEGDPRHVLHVERVDDGQRREPDEQEHEPFATVARERQAQLRLG